MTQFHMVQLSDPTGPRPRNDHDVTSDASDDRAEARGSGNPLVHDGGALTIALVVDTLGGQGNGTSNSAWQYARELDRQGHHVRLVGLGAPRYPARMHRLPFVSWIAAKQRVQFAYPDEQLFRRAFQDVDVVHIYLPFAFGRCALRVAREMGLPVTAGFHLQPENVIYSAGPLRYMPGASGMLYWLFRRWLYQDIAHLHVPSTMIARQLRGHGYSSTLHVISNGYSPRFAPSPVAHTDTGSDRPFRIIVSGRLAREKDQATVIRAIAACDHARDINLVIAGTGPLQRRLRAQAHRLVPGRTSIGFCANDAMPDLLRSGDLFVHASVVDIESLSVLEAIASGLVPVIARSDLSAASQFALLDESLFPAGDTKALAHRIDWWIEHPDLRRDWGVRYAEYAKDHYSIASCVHEFIAMERMAMAELHGSQTTEAMPSAVSSPTSTSSSTTTR